MMRGRLINKIYRGKQLCKVVQVPESAAQSSSLARARFLHELRSKRPPLPALGEGQSGSTCPLNVATGVESHCSSANASTGLDTDVAAAASAARSAAFKAGWLHKASSLQYSHRSMTAAGELHDDAECMPGYRRGRSSCRCSKRSTKRCVHQLGTPHVGAPHDHV